jgi:predicted transposase/invertase (TIGR01784 family)
MKNFDDGLPQILPPTDDAIFKALLTHPRAKAALIDIIKCFIGLPINDATPKNTELPISYILEKQIRLDVNCVTDKGDQVNVEMQNFPQFGDNIRNDYKASKSRSVYHGCKCHASQKSKGVDYKDLVQTFVIFFCGFTLFTDRAELINWFKLRNEEGEVLTDDLNIIFVNMLKSEEILTKPFEKMTGAEMWVIFLTCGGKSKYKAVIDGIMKRKEEIKMAYDVLSDISQDADMRAWVLSRDKYLMDEEHARIAARSEALAEGIAKGKAEVALGMLQEGLDISLISKITELSIAEIEALKR